MNNINIWEYRGKHKRHKLWKNCQIINIIENCCHEVNLLCYLLSYIQMKMKKLLKSAAVGHVDDGRSGGMTPRAAVSYIIDLLNNHLSGKFS